VAAEVVAIDHVGRLLAVAGAAGHIFHLSSADGLATVERWRGQGADLTCEVAPHHLFLGLADYERVGGALKVNPPVRGEPHASALLAALADGRIDCVASDHAPHTPAEKLNDDIADVAAGIAGVETMLPLLLTAVRAGRLTLERLVDATSAAPARSWRLAGKGVLAVGADADLTLVDLARAGLIRAADLHGKHQLTPFDGAATIGEPAAAIVRGRPVMLDGQFVATPGVGSRVVHGRASSQPAHSIHE
jgi:dihydroorotase